MHDTERGCPKTSGNGAKPSGFDDRQLAASQAAEASPRRLALIDRLSLISRVLLPQIVKGVIVRRPWALKFADRLDLDRKALETMQRFRQRYGAAPWAFTLAGRSYAVCTKAQDVRTLLDETPKTFAPGPPEKRAALSHFEPHVSLISFGKERQIRRVLNDKALESDSPMHSMGASLTARLRRELSEFTSADGVLGWEAFHRTWQRIVRVLTLWNRAGNDDRTTDLLDNLRSAGNWAFLHRVRKSELTDLHRRLAAYLVHPESDGLGAALVAQLSDQDQEPTHQLAHWLFAFDAVGITIFRALGLLASRPDLLARARTDDGAFQRACILETLRLWPTTPSLILRGSTRPTVWGEGELPAGTTFFIFVPFLHRDPSYPDADYFTPELWLKGSTPNVRDRVLLPFSGGPGVCPGRHLVLLIGSEAIAALVGSNHLLMNNERFGPGRRMPATYDHTSIGVTLLQPSGKEASS